MAILTQYSSRRWRITLNKEDPNLRLSDLSFSGNQIISMDGEGLVRTIELTKPVERLVLGDDGLQTTANIQIISTSNEGIKLFQAPYLDQVRYLLNADYTQEDLPNEKIVSPFLRQAEYRVYGALKVTEAQYDSTIAPDPIKKEKAILATLYHTAALLVPSLPDIVEGAANQERTRYVELDPEKKIDLLLMAAKDIIDDIDPDIPTVTGKGVPIGSIKRCRTLF